MKVLVMGGTGMLGHMVLEVLKDGPWDLLATWHTGRDPHSKATWKHLRGRVEWHWGKGLLEGAVGRGLGLGPGDWVVNCAGLIPQRVPDMSDTDPMLVSAFVSANTLLPCTLARESMRRGFRVLQIATDCVFSGHKGASYSEDSAKDAVTLYGRTKALGEVEGIHHLRCSIVGPEAPGKKPAGLMGWFLSQEGEVTGYTNHLWNGVTTLAFAEVVRGVLEHDLDLPYMQHLVPEQRCSKAGLLTLFGKCFGRDTKVVYRNMGKLVDRTLLTLDSSKNEELWAAAGHERVPTVEDMVIELAEFMKRAS